MNAEMLGQVGPQVLSDGTTGTVRQGKSAELIIQQLHGRMYEQCARGNLYTFGVSNTALVAANAIVTGLTATAQPVLGLWNPPTSNVNLAIYRAILVLTTVANTAVAPGGFMWLAAAGQQAITTGSVPFNCRTLLQTGSQAKVFSISTALTGLVGSLTALRALDIGVINAAGAATAASLMPSPQESLVDGTLIVPPGGVIAVMNQVSTTTLSYSTGLIWEEIPI